MIVTDPAYYGFTNVTQPCLTGEVNYSGGTPCATPDQYLFWDELHPTAAGQQLVAQEAADLVAPEPGTFLPFLAAIVAMSGYRFSGKAAGRR